MIFQEEKWITAGILAFFIISLFARIMLGILYWGMIKEADNMSVTNNRLLKQCKLRFVNCYQMNNGVSNIPIFVDKFINRLAVGKFSFSTIYHLSGQSMLLSVICCGVGACKGIADGRTLGGIFPFYIVSFLGLYIYFTVSAMVDVKGKRRVLKVNLVDYLENHLSSRIGLTENDLEMLYGRRTVEVMPINSRRLPMADAAPDAMLRETPFRGMRREEVPPAALPSGMTPPGEDSLQSFRITDEELEELLKEFLPT